jgi:cell division protein FtsQ
MNGSSGHEREPDRAALDELERAFADELRVAEKAHDAAGSDEPGGGATQPMSSGPHGIANPGTRSDEDLDVAAGARPVGSDRSNDDQPSGDQLAGGEIHEVDALVDAARSEAQQHQARPEGDRLAGGEIHEVDALVDAARSEAQQRQAGPEEILIIEAEPVVEPEPAAPRIIRIDDYSGSVAIEDLPPVATTGAPASTVVQDRGAAAADADGSVVIAIDDADLPDAVYVEGSLDRSGSRSIVFIQDDDTDDALAPESERDIRRGIEPRMRERRVAVKRAQGRKRLKWVAIVAAIVFVVVGALAIVGSPLFAIKADQVYMTGNVYADPERVQAVIDDLVGTPALLADTERAERELEAIPWVDVARVRTDFPHGVYIEIREREAMTTYQGPDQRFRVLDRDGRVLDVIDNYPFAYVLLSGPDPVDLEAGEFAPRGYAAASELAKNLTGSVRGRVVMIEVTADGSRLVMHLDDGVEVRFGEARDLFAKLVRLETVLSVGGVGESGVIDVSTNEVTL